MIENISTELEKIFGKKIEGMKYTERNAAYGIVISEDGKVAVIKTPSGHFLPGGGVEGNETYRECIEREFVEETGYKVKVDRFIGKASLYHRTKTDRNIYGIGYFFVVSLISKCFEPIEKDHTLIWLEGVDCIKSLFLEHQAWAVSEVLNSHINMKDGCGQ